MYIRIYIFIDIDITYIHIYIYIYECYIYIYVYYMNVIIYIFTNMNMKQITYFQLGECFGSNHMTIGASNAQETEILPLRFLAPVVHLDDLTSIGYNPSRYFLCNFDI